MTDLESIGIEILNQMYSEAQPSADFDEIRENPEEQPEKWYQDHYLPHERQEEIVEEYVEEHDLDSRQHFAITWTCITEYGPRGTPESEAEEALYQNSSAEEVFDVE